MIKFERVFSSRLYHIEMQTLSKKLRLSFFLLYHVFHKKMCFQWGIELGDEMQSVPKTFLVNNFLLKIS